MKIEDRKFIELSLRDENRQYHGTGGVSAGNRDVGFIPAFLDTVTGNAYPSRFANGRPAPVHLFDGLPEALVKKSLVTGKAYALKERLISGFIRDRRFYTRAEAANVVAGQ